MNKFIIVTKSKDLDIEFFNEFLKGFLNQYELIEESVYYLIKHNYDNDKLLIEGFNSFLFDVEINLKLYFGSYDNDVSLKDDLKVITKYFNDSLTNIFYDKKSLLNEMITHNLDDYKSLVLKEYSNDYDMQHTLEVFFLNNMNVLKSSKELYVHRNTLINKLDRFKEKTGFDPKDFKDAYLIYSLIK